jgi:hypothetical protein
MSRNGRAGVEAETCSHRNGRGQEVLESNRPFLETLRQRLTFDTLHHQVVDPVLLSNVMQDANMGMIQAGNGFCFAFKPLFADRIASEVCRQYLDGPCALKPRVSGAIHLAHPARSDRVQDLVRSQPNSGGQWHLAAILHRKELTTPKRRVMDSLRDRIHPWKRSSNKGENEIPREKSRSGERSAPE